LNLFLTICSVRSSPLEPHLPDEAEQFDVLCDAPGGMAELGVEVVDPLLAALLERAEVFAPGASEQLEGVVPPAAAVKLLCMLGGAEVLILEYLGEEVGLGLLPLAAVFDPRAQQRGQFVLEEAVALL